jgi:hypothetical protein
MWSICFKINGALRCFHIPVLIRKPIRIPRPDPDPGPVRWVVGDPDPLPWFTGEGIAAHVANDLQLIATMSELATELSPQLKSKVTGMLKDVAESHLPKDMQLDLGH